jgi:thiamine kinase-like enzyme
MSEFLHNPHKVLNEIVVTENLVNIDTQQLEYHHILEITRQILSDRKGWNDVSLADIEVRSLLGGITNQLLLIENKKASCLPKKVIIRLFGGNTVDFINRQMENIVFSNFSRLAFSPLFYGIFLNGRIEGYLPGSNLLPTEMTQTPNCGNIAMVVAQLHSFSFEEVKYLSSLTFPQLCSLSTPDLQGLGSSGALPTSLSRQWLWNKIGLFFELSSDLSFPTKDQQQKYESLQLSKMYDEFQWYKNKTEDIYAQLKSSSSADGLSHHKKDRLLGRLYGMDEVLCHNDLLSGNIMLVSEDEDANNQEEKRIVLIDYEYAAYNYRAYDIANHFCGKIGCPLLITCMTVLS